MARQQNPKFRKHRNYETVDDSELQINRWVDKCNTTLGKLAQRDPEEPIDMNDPMLKET